MKGSDQMEYDVRYVFAAECFPEGSAVDGVESRKLKASSRNATFSGRLNSRCSSDRSRRARMASIVDLPAVKSDC